MLRRKRKLAASKADALAMCIEHANSARMAGASGREDAQRSIFFLLEHLGESVAPVTQGPDVPDRSAWIDAVRFLEGCPNVRALSGLALALGELERGVVARALVPAGSRRGGKASTDELLAMRAIVEGAAQMKADIKAEASLPPAPGKPRSGPSPTDLYERALEGLQLSRQVVEKYRKRLLSGAPEMHPRPYYSRLQYGEPADLIRRAVAALNQARRG